MKRREKIVIAIWIITFIYAVIVALISKVYLADLSNYYEIHDVLLRIHWVSLVLSFLLTNILLSNRFQKVMKERMVVCSVIRKDTFMPATAQSKNNFSTSTSASQILVEFERADGSHLTLYASERATNGLKEGMKMDVSYKENTIVDLKFAN